MVPCDQVGAGPSATVIEPGNITLQHRLSLKAFNVIICSTLIHYCKIKEESDYGLSLAELSSGRGSSSAAGIDPILILIEGLKNSAGHFVGTSPDV